MKHKGENIETACAKALIDKGIKIAVAESCTGGLISSKLTDLPGSSAYFERGFITYSNEAKIQMLGVADKVIKKHGAVSSQTAVEMAKGAVRFSNATMALAVTGIAGPSGGTSEKPIGTVFIAIADNMSAECEKYNFSGTRHEIREEAAVAALQNVLSYLTVKFNSFVSNSIKNFE